MERGGRRGFVLAVAAVLVATGVSWRLPVAAQSDLEEKAPAPLILSAQADLDLGTLTILGRSLGTAANPPRVSLGGDELVVKESSPQAVVAQLPAGTAPGSHLLIVARGPRRGSSDRFAATIPDNELVTPAGIRVESTGSDVRIKAGNSHVTIDPSGGIVIESTGALAVTSTGALDLRGRTVSVTSDTSLTLMA